MKWISVVLICGIISNSVFANCELARDIKRVPGGFLYTEECHKEVGKRFIENKEYKKQVSNYEELLKLSDKAISIERERSDLWKKTSYELQTRIQNLDDSQHKNNLIYFGAGVILMLGATWAAGQVQK